MNIRTTIIKNQYAVPLLFVLLWSTGFTVSKLGLPYAEPLSFLTLRFFLAASILLLTLGILRGEVLEPKQYFHCAVVGFLIHAVYLGGVFSAIHRGVDAGLAALIVCLQPVLTVLLAAVFCGNPCLHKNYSAPPLVLLVWSLCFCSEGLV